MLKITHSLNRINSITLLLLSATLCSCFPERFRHEKYDCAQNIGGIKTIVFNKTEAGEFAKITTINGEEEASITQIDNQTAILKYENRQLKVNRQTGGVALTHAAKYQSAICKKTVFTM
jgi:hypothetical protein